MGPVRVAVVVNKPNTLTFLGYEQVPKQSQFDGLLNECADLKPKGFG